MLVGWLSSKWKKSSTQGTCKPNWAEKFPVVGLSDGLACVGPTCKCWISYLGGISRCRLYLHNYLHVRVTGNFQFRRIGLRWITSSRGTWELLATSTLGPHSVDGLSLNVNGVCTRSTICVLFAYVDVVRSSWSSQTVVSCKTINHDNDDSTQWRTFTMSTRPSSIPGDTTRQLL